MSIQSNRPYRKKAKGKICRNHGPSDTSETTETQSPYSVYVCEHTSSAMKGSVKGSVGHVERRVPGGSGTPAP